MPVDLDNVINDTAFATVPLGNGNDLQVTYRPNVITPEMMSKAMAGQSLDQFLKICVQFIVDWDLMTGDQKVQITEERLQTVPVVILKKIFERVIEQTRGSGEA